MPNDDTKLATITTSQDDLRASLEALRRLLPVMAELGPEIARARKQLFDAYVAAGFDQKQALELCKSIEL